MGSSIDGKKIHVELKPPPNTNNQDYAGGTNDNTRDSQTRETGDSWSETDSCARNIDEEHRNEEDNDYIDPPFKKKIELIRNYKNKSGIGYYTKKIIQMNQSGYVWHWKPLKVDFISWLRKKKNDTKDKWNQLNLINIQSLLCNNQRLPLSHMAKSYIWLE